MARRWLITGGSGGIGLAIARAALETGDSVRLVARSAEGLERALKRLAAAGHVADTYRADLEDESQVAACIDAAGAIDVLVHAAGRSHSARTDQEQLGHWRDMLEANANTAFLVTRAALPQLKARGSGRLVYVASTAGLEGQPYVASYSAGKHAVIGLMRAVAAEVAGSGVTANAVCPTFVDTPMTDVTLERIRARTGLDERSAREALSQKSALRRLLDPEEVAHAVAFLASERSAGINGHCLVIDGGPRA